MTPLDKLSFWTAVFAHKMSNTMGVKGWLVSLFLCMIPLAFFREWTPGDPDWLWRVNVFSHMGAILSLCGIFYHSGRMADGSDADEERDKEENQ